MIALEEWIKWAGLCMKDAALEPRFLPTPPQHDWPVAVADLGAVGKSCDNFAKGS